MCLGTVSVKRSPQSTATLHDLSKHTCQPLTCLSSLESMGKIQNSFQVEYSEKAIHYFFKIHFYRRKLVCNNRYTVGVLLTPQNRDVMENTFCCETLCNLTLLLLLWQHYSLLRLRSFDSPTCVK